MRRGIVARPTCISRFVKEIMPLDFTSGQDFLSLVGDVITIPAAMGSFTTP